MQRQKTTETLTREKKNRAAVKAKGKKKKKTVEKKQIGYIFMPPSLNHSHLNLLLLWESFKTMVHTHIHQFSKLNQNQKEGKKKLCHRTTSIHYSIYLSALLFACSIFFGILLGKKVGWEKEANTEKHWFLASFRSIYLITWHFSLEPKPTKCKIMFSGLCVRAWGCFAT